MAERCLSILLFSDTPALGVERIRRILPQLSYHARHLIGVLGLCHAPEAAEFLADLINNHTILHHWSWEYVRALAENPHPQGRKALLRLLDALGTDDSLAGNDRSTLEQGLGEALASVAKEDREIWLEMERRCVEVVGSSQRAALIWALENLGTEEAAMAACLLLKDGLHFPGWHIVENALFYRIEAETPNSYYLQPKPANAFRKRLMEQVLHDPNRQRSSLALLAEIESRRLDVGKPLAEPRHPDITALADIPTQWPLLYAE